MALTAADIIASPEIYPFSLDVQRQLLQLVRMTRAGYRAASFLDGRMLTPAMEIGGAPVPVLAVAAKQVQAKPLRFIFHTGHVGSTLLSRLLDEVPGVLGLREPLPLRTLADRPDPRILETLLRLWSRGYEDTHHVIVKASSMAGVLAPMMLETAPDSRGVYLHLKAEPYLATIIAGTDTVKDQAAAFAYLAHGCGSRHGCKDNSGIPQPPVAGRICRPDLSGRGSGARRCAGGAARSVCWENRFRRSAGRCGWCAGQHRGAFHFARTCRAAGGHRRRNGALFKVAGQRPIRRCCVHKFWTKPAQRPGMKSAPD